MIRQSTLARSTKQLGLLTIWTLAACTSQPPVSESTSAPIPNTGITGMSLGSPDLRTPPSTPEGETWIYQLGLPFQVDQDTGGFFCNIRVAGVKGTDFENGSDIILFKDLSNVSAESAIPITRNHNQPNPNSEPPNQEAIMVKYPVMGGFVPRGARRADGSPHPHAGTGFGINQASAWRTDFEGPPPYGVNMFGHDPRGLGLVDPSESYSYLELHQLAYDGDVFQVVKSERLTTDALLSGWSLIISLMTAIPDGDDLLFAMQGHKPGETASSGLARWKNLEGEWRPFSFVPITGGDGATEASAVRDLDGSRLFSARGGSAEAPESPSASHDIRVWRSQDEGETWEKIVHVRGLISKAPIVLNTAADGTPYIAANLYEVFLEGLDRIKIAKDSRGRPIWGGRSRKTLCFWPLNEDRSGLLAPILARNLREEFGPPPGGTGWRVDHPVAVTLRLADGGWHNVIALRILEYGELSHMQMPTSHTGAYLEEVKSAGEPVAIWNF